MNTTRAESGPDLNTALFEGLPVEDREALEGKTFRRMIAIERKRTERSKEPFLLMLIEPHNGKTTEATKAVLLRLADVLLVASRETDIVGWYKDQAILGVLFTGLVGGDRESIINTIQDRVKSIFHGEVTSEDLKQVSISFHFFPDDWDHDRPGRPSNPALYLDLIIPAKRRKPMLVVKRTIDIVGSALALAACSPLFLAIAVAVKLTSEGPVFFKQQRVGQYGKLFTFLKFRSMFVNNDARVHQQFMAKMIQNEAHSSETGKTGVYKIKDDKRITRVGRFLRRTSLDELPQFINVLNGEMSLVGPRPAIPYELASYQTWHRRRVLEAKPGITGVWQVAGRSRVKFDEMVRMDLRYAMSWSPWLDVKILLLTPLAVIKGSGAY